MIGNSTTISSQIASIYNSNTNKLAEVMGRIASGLKISKPSDDFVGYLKAQKLQTNIDGYSTVKEDLTEARGVASMAVEVGNGIYEDLGRMKELATMVAELDPLVPEEADDIATYNAEFVGLARSIVDTIDNNKYENTAVVSAATLKSVYLNPDNTTDTLSITFDASDIISITSATVSAWDLSATDDGAGDVAKTAADVQTELDKITSYVVKAEGYVSKIDRQIDITDTIMESKEASKSLITDIDEVAEIQESTKLQIRQQASIAMLAQANLLNSSIARLYGT
ncbi:MAG: hypothetical protein JW795_11000 [Chitinivibrionales bacterium]|nr:hypothetical protein [Chitinivibrionales bacterium]